MSSSDGKKGFNNGLKNGIRIIMRHLTKRTEKQVDFDVKNNGFFTGEMTVSLATRKQGPSGNKSLNVYTGPLILQMVFFTVLMNI